MAAYWLALVPGQRGKRYTGPDLTWVYSGRRDFNRVVAAHLEAADADARIADVVRRFGGWGAHLTWLVGPSSRPSDLPQRLTRQGFVRAGEWTGMALDLTRPAPPPFGRSALPAGLEVREVATGDGDGLRLWMEVLRAAFRLPPPAWGTFRDLVTTPPAGGPGGWHRYVGLLAGRPVSTATLFTGAGAAGLYLVATVPGARRRGLAMALTRHALDEARERGHRLAVLQATPPARDLYRRTGFQECCTVGVYRWAPAGLLGAARSWLGGLPRLWGGGDGPAARPAPSAAPPAGR
jgi:ribosomal protein S18 acetylase RimI-like enzyme